MTDIINEIMDFFLSLIVDKSIQGINKCNLKKIVSFLIIFVISIFSLGLLGLWFYMAGEYFVAIFVWVLMVVFIIIAFKILHKIMKT